MNTFQMNFKSDGPCRYRLYNNKIYLVSAGENFDECY